MTLPISASASEIEPVRLQEKDSKDFYFYYECIACHRRFITLEAVETHLLCHSADELVYYLKKSLTEATTIA
jgi:hypothetical protein